MSVQAAVNGAQRDIGLYAGIDGAVRALFEEEILNVQTGTDSGSPVMCEFSIGDNAPFALLMGRYNESGSIPEIPLVGSAELSESNMAAILVVGGEIVYSDSAGSVTTISPYYRSGVIGMKSGDNSKLKGLAYSLYTI